LSRGNFATLRLSDCALAINTQGRKVAKPPESRDGVVWSQACISSNSRDCK